jgi:hypothetical protein
MSVADRIDMGLVEAAAELAAARTIISGVEETINSGGEETIISGVGVGGPTEQPGPNARAVGPSLSTPVSEQKAGPNAGQDQGGGQGGPANDIAQFMARVVPWPAQGEPGFINLHWRIPNPHDAAKSDLWTGKPTRTVNEFMNLLDWVKRQKSTRDIYFCLSLQSKTALSRKGAVTAARHGEDALLLKSLWLDIDVKPPPKGYASVEEALSALDEFVKAADLPPTSALVGSGGGLHAYWIFTHPLPPPEWQRYANGLKVAAQHFGLHCDIGCTVDSVRLLRVPGTFNHKTDPARPVTLMGTPT